MKNLFLSFISLILIISNLSAQRLNQMSSMDGGPVEYTVYDKCVSDEEHQNIAAQLTENAKQLRAEGKLTVSAERQTTSFTWPLRKTAALGFNSYYATTNFVDHELGSGITDYNCDGRSYNGHNGIDIITWPFSWYLYDNDMVEVIAGAAGTIIGKSDGNADDHCSCIGTWNAVYIQHADGSIAWYGHMKDGTLTTKSIGQTVSQGEYLGVVASSGCSTDPHLHFEVYETTPYTAANRIDPYQGTCNTYNTTSWWASQPPNRTPTLNALLTHNAAPILGCPGVNEEPNFSNAFIPGETVYTAAYWQDRENGNTTNFRLRRPNNSLYSSWSQTNTGSTSTAYYWYWTWNLPTSGPFGTWTLEADHGGTTYTHAFTYTLTLPVELSNFTARLNQKNETELNWQTEMESNNQGFNIEHSEDGESWARLGFVAGAGTTDNPQAYSYSHLNPVVGTNYYRLQQIDFDGDTEYSEVAEVFLTNDKEDIRIYPNPSHSSITIMGLPENETSNAVLTDITGKLIRQFQLSDNQVDISSLPTGVYLLSITTGNKRITKRLVKE